MGSNCGVAGSVWREWRQVEGCAGEGGSRRKKEVRRCSCSVGRGLKVKKKGKRMGWADAVKVKKRKERKRKKEGKKGKKDGLGLGLVGMKKEEEKGRIKKGNRVGFKSGFGFRFWEWVFV